MALNFRNNPTEQQAFIDSVRQTGNISVSADKIGRGRNTCYNYMKDNAEFAEQVQQARLEYTGKMSKSFQEHGPEALETLLSVIRDKKAPATARTNAAKAILDYSKDWGEAIDMENKIAELQGQIDEAERGLM